MKGIFYNSKKSTCSIHETGVMCFHVLKKSSLYELEYSEEEVMRYDVDFVVFNYHHNVCRWINPSLLQQFKGLTFTIVTEVSLYTLDLAPHTSMIFDHYLILDPTIKETSTMHAFPRPLLDCSTPVYPNNNRVVIGSFGLPTFGKKWGDIVQKTIDEYGLSEDVLIRFNVPRGTHVPGFIHDSVMNEIQEAGKKVDGFPNIKFELTTHNFQTQQEMVDWCAQNTINVFLYDRHHVSGLSAVTDQAILAERPLLVSSHATFRHIHKYLPNSSQIGIKEAIKTTREGVLRMKKDWSAAIFVQKFEDLLLQSK